MYRAVTLYFQQHLIDLDNVEGIKNALPNAESYQKIKNQLQILENQALEAAEPLLRHYDDSQPNKENLEKIKNFYKKTKYFLRISEKLSIFASAYEDKGK